MTTEGEPFVVTVPENRFLGTRLSEGIPDLGPTSRGREERPN